MCITHAYHAFRTIFWQILDRSWVMKYRYRVIIVSNHKILCYIVWIQKKYIVEGWSSKPQQRGDLKTVSIVQNRKEVETVPRVKSEFYLKLSFWLHISPLRLTSASCNSKKKIGLLYNSIRIASYNAITWAHLVWVKKSKLQSQVLPSLNLL